MVLVPAALYRREQNFLAHAVAGRGTVAGVTITPTSQRGSNYTYTPTIRFADATGRVLTVLSRAPGRASYVVGQELAVLYDARDHRLVQPDDPASINANWRFGLGFAIPGSVLLPVSLYQAISVARELARRRRQAAATPAGP